MKDFTFYGPTYFAFGKGKETSVGQYVKRFNGSKVLIHFGGGSAIKSGLIGRVEDSLKTEGIEYLELGGVKPNPRSGLIYEAIDLCKKEKVDFILAVGGGSVIDSAKAIAAGAVYDGDFWDFFEGKASIEKALPLGTILTIAASGSEGSPDTVITYEDGMYKRAADGEAIRPAFSVLNPELTLSLPDYQTACGVTDIMSHVLERYITNTKDVEITDRLCEGILLAMIKEGKRVMANPSDYEARANIMWAAVVAHNDIVGVGREQDWGTHHLEHELSSLYDCAHGAGLAVMFPAWMKFTYKHDMAPFLKLATRVWGCQMNYENPELTALEGIERFEEFLKSIGMPTSFAEIGAKEEDIPTLVENLFYKKPDHGSFVKLTRESSAEIYKLACK